MHERRGLVCPRCCFRPGFLPPGHRRGVDSYVKDFGANTKISNTDPFYRLSWADTNASTFGRLWGKKTKALPRSFLGLPFAPRKSLAGFIAASLTGALTAVAFWGWFAPSANRPEVSWTWGSGFSAPPFVGSHNLENARGDGSLNFAGWAGLGIIGVFAGLVSGVAEALGDCLVCTLLRTPLISCPKT